MHGIQAWVALPDRDGGDRDPAFSHHAAGDLPDLRARRRAGARLIAGEAFGAKAKVRDPFADVLCALASSTPARAAALPAEYPERAAYVAKGAVEIDGRDLHAGPDGGVRARRAPSR